MMFKAALHVHTQNSDGGDPLGRVIDDHYSKGYDILSINEHNYQGHWGLTRDWLSAPRSVTPERFDEIAAGVGRGGRQMLQIPLTVELSRHPHLNAFFVDYNGADQFMDHEWFSHDNFPSAPPQARLIGEAQLRRSLEEVQNQHGLAHLNHLGRETSDPEEINTYVGLFMEFDRCVGMEIINQQDRDPESTNSRIMWDNINSVTIPQGRFVWGFSNDDLHNVRVTGYSYNVMLMPVNTLDEFRVAMQSGSFYAVAKIARNEGVNAPLSTPAPEIAAITRTGDTIAITATGYDRIDWLSQGTQVIGTGARLNLADAAGLPFVRANVIGPGGIAFIQPSAVQT